MFLLLIDSQKLTNMLCTTLCFLFTVTVGVGMYVLNTEDFDYIVNPSDHTHSSLQEQADNFIKFKLKMLGKQTR